MRKGAVDLRLGLVWTPLPLCETLRDDPLRITLRAVRFARCLGFKVYPELRDAGGGPAMHAALVHRVIGIYFLIFLKQMRANFAGLPVRREQGKVRGQRVMFVVLFLCPRQGI